MSQKENTEMGIKGDQTRQLICMEAFKLLLKKATRCDYERYLQKNRT